MGNFFSNPYILIKNKIYKVQFPLLLFITYIPNFILTFICKIFKIKIIYTEEFKYKIIPSYFNNMRCDIMKIYVNYIYKNNRYSEDLTYYVKNYDYDIPIYFFIKNCGYMNFSYIVIKYKKNNLIKEKTIYWVEFQKTDNMNLTFNDINNS